MDETTVDYLRDWNLTETFPAGSWQRETVALCRFVAVMTLVVAVLLSWICDML